MNTSPRQKNVLVTGAGSGIGRAVATRLAGAGYAVTGTVRDPERARSLTAEAAATSPALRFLPLDLLSASSIEGLAAAVEAAGGVDIVVHNAGHGVFGAVEDVEAAAVARQFAANLFGPLDLTRRLLPGLRARRGQLIWMGSLAGRISLPFQAHYSATKSAVASLSDALRMELRPHGVRVTCVEPGDFATGFTDARQVVAAQSSAYAPQHQACLAAVDKQERAAPSPEWVANLVERLCRTPDPPARAPVGENARTLCLLLRLLPDRLREWIVRKMYAQA
ncbi:MAG: SDR family NAD(P)-dependent oxidoreductase [Acidobacteriota bacterium]